MTVKSAVGPSPNAFVAYTEHWKVAPGMNVSIVNSSSSEVVADTVSGPVHVSV